MSRRKGICWSTIAAAAAIAGVAERARASFTGFQSTSDLVLVEVASQGDGDVQDAVSLQELTTGGAAVGSPLDLPTAAGQALTLPDTSNHDGQLELSSNGKFLVIPTYLANVGTPDASGYTAAEVPRVVTLITAAGQINSSTQLTSTGSYDGVNIRQAISIDGLEFWSTGNNGKPYSDPDPGDVGGFRYETLGSNTSVDLNNGLGFDQRSAIIWNGQMYVDTGSDNSPAGTHVIYQTSPALPTSDPVTYSTLPLTGGGSVEGNQSPNFDTLANGTNVLYETNSTENSVDKLVENDGTWTFEGRVSLPGAEDLTTSVDGNSVNIYVTTDSGLYDMTDTGGDGPISSTFQTLMAAPAGVEFRGISFAPTPFITSQWGLSTGGQYGVTANWTNGVPWNPGDTAEFGQNLTTSGAVTLNGSWTIGHVIFNNAAVSYSITAGTPAGVLNLNDTGGVGQADVTVQSGSHTISAPIALTNGMGVNFSANTALTLSNTITGPGNISVNGAGTLALASTAALPSTASLSIAGGAKVSVAAGSPIMTLAGLTFGGSLGTPQGTLDLTNNELLINYGSGPDPITSIEAYLSSGYNGGAWNGPGIMSTNAQTTTDGLYYSLGFADSADPGNPAGLPSDTIEVKYTLVGDLNLDGIVDGLDFSLLAGHWQTFTPDWDAGDLLYHGVVNGLDFSQFVANFGHTATGGSVTLSAADWAAFDSFTAQIGETSEVPEPASAGFLAAAAAGLLAGRRRRRNRA